MERIKQKSKKDKPNKYEEKEKSSSFRIDVKTLKENLKINEILRTVKMNSSMRIKAPRGSKVMHSKYFNDTEDIFEGATSSEGQDEEPPSATNTVLNTTQGHVGPKVENVVPEKHSRNNEVDSNTDVVEPEISVSDKTDFDTSFIHKSKNPSEDCAKDEKRAPSGTPVLAANIGARSGDRKLSLDHTMLSRREGLSQSEVDLNSIGKLPLERKSSFFRKKMDSFLKNTTEIFRWQSLNNKSTRSPLAQRRGSVCSRMSVSMQSLNENAAFYEEHEATNRIYPEQQGSVTSLRSSTSARSNSTVSVNVSDRPPDLSEEESLAGSQPLADTTTLSIHSLNEGYMQDSLLNTRAISMSSGLDTAKGERRRKTSRSNRVTWLASESLTDYFRRLIQDEKSQEMQECHSYQDFLSIPENTPVGPRTDSKARRLSYARAVSGEDPVLPSRYQDTSFRRKKIPENEAKALPEIESYLAMFERNGIPELPGYTPYKICDEAEALLQLSLDSAEAVEKYLDLSPEITTNLSVADEMKQEIIKEFIYTEAAHIDHLKVVVKVYIATAHALQSCGVLLQLNTSTLFAHIPDVLNSNVMFWEKTVFPTIQTAKRNMSLFDPSLILPGLYEFAEIFDCYYEYMKSQKTALDYANRMLTDAEYNTYIAWCNQRTSNRLEFGDMLAKPMQRITRYDLIISRLAHHVSGDMKRELEVLAYNIKSFGLSVNRSVRQRDETTDLEELKIEAYQPNFKNNEEMEKSFQKFNKFNLLFPMVDCGPISRCLVHQGVLRYKDFLKEFDAQVLIFTDMILICKKYPKKKDNPYWKMLRPKIMLNRTVPNIKPPKSTLDTPTLTYVELDEHGCSKGVFQLSESKDQSSRKKTLKQWEHLIYEAIISYTLTKWYYKYPVRDLAIIEKNYNDENFKKQNPEICKDEENARLRVAATFHDKPLPAFIRDVEIHMVAIDRERGPPHLHSIFESGMKNFNARQTRSSSFHHQSTTSRSSHHRSSSELPILSVSHEGARSVSLQRSGSSMEQNLPLWLFDDSERGPPHLHSIFESGMKNFNARQTRSSSFHHQSTTSRSSHHRSSSELPILSVSHEGARSVSLQRSGSSMEQNLPLWLFDDIHHSPSISVNFMTKDDLTPQLPSPPTLVLHQPSPHLSPGPRSASACGDSENMLRVTPSHTMVHSLPDINAEPHLKPEPRIAPHTASAKLYRSHQELMQRNRLVAGQHYLSPDNRGSSYPPQSPRASLKRGLAFSYSFKSNPPLTRASKASSILDIPDMPDKPRRLLIGNSSTQLNLQLGVPLQRSPSPSTINDLCMTSTSAVQSEKKSLFQRRTKKSTGLASSERNTPVVDHSDNDDTDDDKSRRRSINDEMEKPSVETCILADQGPSQSEESKQEDSKKPMDKEKA